ncbi:MAG: UDP-N-acetylmuramyl-tripeptide synthetase [Candidatus Pacebacteria bacterium]|nr:UDP-N-acetylmuramyl-tripeptide synthetase [Candidatus Paceibacterota bacterium]
MTLETFFVFLKRFIPRKLFVFFQPVYHRLLAFFAALIYCFPSRKIFVVGVTGTKGKTTVLEIINAILEQAGFKTALMSTLRFKVGDEEERNELKMTMPGRFFVQKFLRKAAKGGCEYALLEMTSQGVSQSRHKFIALDSMIFTNLAAEHIESHGSFEKYREAKVELFKALQKSRKKKKVLVLNKDDENIKYFLPFKAEERWAYGIEGRGFEENGLGEDFKKLYVSKFILRENGIDFEIGEKSFSSKLLGEFNLYNLLAAVSFALSQSVGESVIKKAVEKFSGVSGRVEFINEGQDFKIVVDYAHTPDSLQKLYEVFQASRRICVLGATGGGRDKWKRIEFGRIAAANCDEIILTNEDPYDENPAEIISNIAMGIESPFKYKIMADRRDAIREALRTAKKGDTVLITGKGTDPFIMGPNGSKIRWDDRDVAREEIGKILNSKQE